MKRTFGGFWCATTPDGRVRVDADGRALVATHEAALRDRAEGCDDLVRCALVLPGSMRRVPVGRASAERRAAGGPRVVGRPALSLAAWATLVSDLWQRAGGRCECCGAGPGVRGPLDPEHVLACSQGGADDLDNVWLACRYGCHAAKHRHELAVTALGGGRFTFTWQPGHGPGARAS